LVLGLDVLGFGALMRVLLVDDGTLTHAV